jgi:7-cyano-7-deazaguanine synthase in queuosine biosynthesis
VKEAAPVFRFRFDGSTVLGTMPGTSEQTEMQFFVDDEPIAKSLGARLKPLHADLVDVAAAVHIADRQAKRQPDGELWRRRFAVEIPVRSLEVWKRQRVTEALSDLLKHLTGDGWEFLFSSRPCERRSSEQQDVLFPPPDDAPISVGLFSGGLDAFAGTVASISADKNQHFVCVSGTPSRRQEQRQHAQAASLREVLKPRSLTSIRVPCWLHSADETNQEPSRRTRGFLFLSLGAAAAIAANARSLSVYENGIGAINLPYERTPIGIPNSRAVQPLTLLLFSRFVEAVTDERFGVKSPCVFQTKAEMCQHPELRGLERAIAETFSCDGFPVHRAGKPQCGVCTSCILRRLSLFGGGLELLDQTSYGCDLLASGELIRPKRLKGLFSMDWQVGRLERALGSQSPWTELIIEFPDLRETCTSLATLTGESCNEVQEKLIRLYSKHCAEWASFPARNRLQVEREAA